MQRSRANKQAASIGARRRPQIAPRAPRVPRGQKAFQETTGVGQIRADDLGTLRPLSVLCDLCVSVVKKSGPPLPVVPGAAEAELAHAAGEGGAVDAEDLGGAAGAIDLATGHAQDAVDIPALECVEGLELLLLHRR